ncbi:GNAT family N-acetyltransferase, partial [Klebsiella variicola]
YLLPVTQSVAGFVHRFSAEGMSLIDYLVLLAGDEPAAIAIVARRGSAARLAALAQRPAWPGKGQGPENKQDKKKHQQQQWV